jgi:hypothetical protein
MAANPEEVKMRKAQDACTLEFPVGTPGSTTRTVLKGTERTPTETAWLTATIRPAGTFGPNGTGRLRALLDALSACASIVVLDMQAVRLNSRRAGEVIEEAAREIESRGGCLMCINADNDSRACLSAAGDHAVLIDDEFKLVAPR